jgi:predicted HTH domain antitoxin
MKAAIAIPERIRKKFLNEILEMYSQGEISAGKGAEMLGVSRAAFYQLLAEKGVSLPEKLNQSMLGELRGLRNKKGCRNADTRRDR